MAAQTKQALEVARQFKKAIALDLVTSAAQEAYDLLKDTVRQGMTISQSGKPINRQHLDAAKALITMAGLSERASETHEKDTARMSLAELEAMIKDLRVIDGNATDAAQPIAKPLDFLD